MDANLIPADLHGADLSGRVRTSDPVTMRIVRGALPDYRGRKVYVARYRPGMSLNSYWDSGNRDYWTWWTPAKSLRYTVEQNGTPFDRKDFSAPDPMPPGMFLIQHAMRGESSYVVVYIA